MGDEARLSRRDLFRGLMRRGMGSVRAEGSAGGAVAGGAVEGKAGGAASGPGGKAAGGMGPRSVALPIHRPPGAVDEAAFLAGCTRCNECISACPVGAITLAPARFRGAAGTPMIDVHASACVMCADTPCISACGARVLRREQPLKMGVAWIQPMACLAHNGSFCTVCAERCPVPGAIRLESGRPSIDPSVCTGCGTCAYVCPAPSNAVVVMPLADRPAPPGDAAASGNGGSDAGEQVRARRGPHGDEAEHG